MSGNSTKYATTYVLVSNAIAVEARTVEVTRNSGRQRQETMAKGWAGTSGGAAFMTFSVDNAVPQAGLENDFYQAALRGDDVEIGVMIGGKVQKIQGVILTDSIKGGVGQASSYSFSGEGPWDSTFE